MQYNVDEIRILVSRSDGDKSYTQAMSTKGRPQSPWWTHFEKVGGMFPNCESYRILALSSRFRVCVYKRHIPHFFHLMMF